MAVRHRGLAFPEVDAKLIIPLNYSIDKDMEVQGGTEDPAVHYTPSIITEDLVEQVREDCRWRPDVEIRIPKADVFASTHTYKSWGLFP